jgi:hypothetical protein
MSSGSSLETSGQQSLAMLDEALARVAPEAVLLDARILRRVIRLDRRLKGLGLRVPHDKTYTIERARLLAYVDHRELPPNVDLASIVILLSKPTEQEVEDWEPSRLLSHYWRLLFHSRVHVTLAARYPSLDDRQAVAEQRKFQLGPLEFEEIRSVLLKDQLLFQEHTDWEVYAEFVALSLELKHFTASDLPFVFPSIAQWEMVHELLDGEVEHSMLYDATQLLSGAEEIEESPKPSTSPLRKRLDDLSGRWSNKATANHEKWQEKASGYALLGNHVKAAMHWRMAAQSTTGKRAALFRESSLKEMGLLIDKLRRALGQLETGKDQWLAGLNPALDAAACSSWSVEARLLYDLQKICVEDESESQRADLMGWLTSLGREPCTRPLPLLKHVLRTKYIRSAQRRLIKSQLSDVDRRRLATLLSQAGERAEQLLRDAIRPRIHQQLDRVGLAPENIPERVARNKLVEELLDHLVEYGYITSGMLRDALSKGDLKLRDVSARELLLGDQFLLADRYLTKPLDGVYRPAPVYLRWSQRLSSLGFGTRTGRFLTLHLALPFGGAFLLVEGVRHVIAWFAGSGPDHSSQLAELVNSPTPDTSFSDQYAGGQSGVLSIIAWVLLSGLFIYLLMHRPAFRATCASYGYWALQWTRRILLDWPARLLRIPLIEQLLYSPLYAPLRTYLVKPGLVTAVVLWITKSFLPEIDFRYALEVFLVLALLLNSSIGRYADEWFTDQVLRTIEDLRARVFGALFQWVMELFQQLLTGLDRILHTLDEWSRFRTRDNRWVKVGKFVTGTLWSVIAYFVVLVSTLLVEPQINPIKHFPVVTVSHKLLLPLGPFFVVWLTPLLGTTQANTLVWSTIWLIPGVFGFLVWELRGNWRLYAANRPNTLQPQSVGSHGETMLALLRPSFHSGTLPKLFTRLRRAMRKARETGNQKALARQQTSLNVVQHQVQRFVERELMELLAQSVTVQRNELSVQSVQLATNCVRVAVVHSDKPHTPLWISWEESQLQMVAKVSDMNPSWALTPVQQDNFAWAIEGLLQRTGTEHVKANLSIQVDQPITWSRWVDWWSQQNIVHNQSNIG